MDDFISKDFHCTSTIYCLEIRVCTHAFFPHTVNKLVGVKSFTHKKKHAIDSIADSVATLLTCAMPVDTLYRLHGVPSRRNTVHRLN